MVFMGCLSTFYQNSFPSHLLDSDSGRLLFVYVKFTKILTARSRSFSIVNLVDAQRWGFRVFPTITDMLTFVPNS